MPDNLRILSKILTENGYIVRKALNGSLALISCQTTLPDMILLDIKMPEMNGYELCQHLKANRKTRDIPVIFISCLGDALDKVKAFEVGGVDYITKPFQAEEVLSRIAHQLKLRSLPIDLQNKNLSLQQEIDSTLLLLQHRLRGIETHPPIEVIKEYGDLPKITCYASQLNQVFLHILNNAKWFWSYRVCKTPFI